MKKLVLIDGNSIMNRAFYGIMGSKALTTKDGKYTNAIYGFLAILFKLLEDEKPDYIGVSFDLKAPTARHKMYEGYKANRKGMPTELAEQMPIIKDVLRAMNIDIIEKEGYEGDDIIGTLSRYGEQKGLEVVILSGDRDTFQLATDNVRINIPRTKAGKTETEIFNREKVKEVYGIEPKQLIEVKGLQGDTSDNIPGVPGIGEKTALSLVQKYGTIDNLYKKLESGEADIKGKQKEKLEENKDLAYLSRTLGEINTQVPIEDTLEELKLEEWDKPKVLEIFKELNFKRYIDRFNLQDENGNANLDSENNIENKYKVENKTIEEIKSIIENQSKMIFYIETEKDENEEKIIKEKITVISVFNTSENEAYYINLKEKNSIQDFKEIFENDKILKSGIDLGRVYILLKQEGIDFKGINYDASIAAYILNPTNNKLKINDLAEQYLEIDVNEILGNNQNKKAEQINLFDTMQNAGISDKNEQKEEKSEEEKIKEEQEKAIKAEEKKCTLYSYIIYKLQEITMKKLEEINAVELFKNIDMPTITVLANMQWNGMYADEEELDKFGNQLKEQLEIKTKMIYEMAGEEFNINSTKQLGEILFEKMKLPVVKKTKSGYSTDVDVLEKLKSEDPIISEILDYRQLMKLNSTYVEGLKPYINPKTKRIHSFFHQTITATGRISSTEPNLQNIPTRFELGKQVRKIFKPEPGKVYIDADYSQIELRVLAHMSEDTHMVQAFKDGEDIHKQAASKVFKTPMEEVTKEQRSNAKAVNFGIVYGISDFGLGEQLGISRKIAKKYIEEYLQEYEGIKNFMDNMKEKAKETGYVETLFNRRRYIPELKSNNYMVRQFGERAAMNTPIQGTAADIMKIAMINVYKKLVENGLEAKIVLQVHDEMMIEAPLNEAEKVKEIVKNEMESAIQLKIPLIAEVSEAENWYECK
ncbi:dNA polymerase [Clostridium sp. CAG:389]|nr:dNA polymerase [Clostridium sp. CAG:389]